MLQVYDIPPTYISDYFNCHSFLSAVTLRLFSRVLHRIGRAHYLSSSLVLYYSPVHTDCTSPWELHIFRFVTLG